jgi:sulfide dehydrogenase cytochrome subunit
MTATPTYLRAALASGLLALGIAAQAQPAAPQALYVKTLAATCANCHGTNGKALPEATVPGLAGTAAPLFTEQMNAFKSGARPATVMHQIAKGFNDQQIAQLAAYFAAQPR